MNGKPELTDKIVDQIMEIRASGQANMLDTLHVQSIANDMRFYELVLFIEDNKQAYAEFILYGRTVFLQVSCPWRSCGFYLIRSCYDIRGLFCSGPPSFMDTGALCNSCGVSC